MSAIRKDRLIAAYGLTSIGIAIFAFQCNRYWFVSMSVVYCMNAALLWHCLHYSILLCVVFGLGAVLPLNWLFTELFFDPTVLGLNQVIFCISLSVIIDSIAVIYGIRKAIAVRKKRASELACKRAARDKYRAMIDRVDEIDGKVGMKTDMVNELFKKLEQLK